MRIDPLLIDQIIEGDCFDLVRTLPDASVQLVITSPPYFQQRDYGSLPGEMGSEPLLAGYIDRLIDLLRECQRVIIPTGSIVVNLGDKYIAGSLQLVPYRFAAAVTDRLPLTLVNAITWVKRNPTPRQFRRRLVSSTEPFFHFVKTDEYYYDIDAFLQGDRPAEKKRGAGQRVGQSYFDLIAKSELSDAQKERARRDLYEVIAEVQSGRIESFRMKIRGLHSLPFGGQAGGRQMHLDTKGFTIIRIHGNPLKKDVIEMPVESVKGNQHPAIYPVELVKEFLHLLTQPGDLVLDPFMGSGSTALACQALGRRFIGFELNPAYVAAARQRLGQFQPVNELFTESL